MDGTTDVTRTFHYGTPSKFEVEVYTRVLMGSIDLARAVFPDGTKDTRLDILARYHLFKVGLNYRHGTGHGIGAYGFIHESPVQASMFFSWSERDARGKVNLSPPRNVFLGEIIHLFRSLKNVA